MLVKNATRTNPARAIKRIVNFTLSRLFGFELVVRRLPGPDPEVEAMRPFFSDSAWKRATRLDFGIFDPERKELFLTHNEGLFSCLSVTLWSIFDLLSTGQIPVKINFTGALSAYKDELHQNIFNELFESDVTEKVLQALNQYPATRFKRFNHHDCYQHLDSELLTMLIHAYLRANASVIERANLLRSRYINPDKRYVGVWIRGTDKADEVPHTDSAMYIERVEKLLDSGAVDRVLIQTDQAQICKLFKSYFRGICDVIEELPVTHGKVAIHRTDAIEGQRLEFARSMIAAVSIIASMPHVVTHTGNIGAWITMLRGSNDVWQATSEGILLQQSLQPVTDAGAQAE